MADITKIKVGTDEYIIKDNNAKRLQSPVSLPSSSSGTTTSFVDSITQNAEGVISYTTKSISAEIPGTAEYAEALAPGARIDGVTFDGSANITHYGTVSSRSGDTLNIICPGFGSSTDLAAGARIDVYFDDSYAAIGSNGLSFNIKASSSDTTGTGAKVVKYRGAYSGFPEGATLSFVYDGTYWQQTIGSSVPTTYSFADNYNASTNKGATEATVTNAINALDVTTVTVGASKTLASIGETNGKIVVATPVNIAIAANQVSGTASSAAYFDSNGKLAAHSSVTETELGYLDGATSNIQQQINSISGGGTDHIRFSTQPFSFPTGQTSTTTNVSAVYIKGGYAVSAGDTLVDANGIMAKVGSVSSNTATITKTGELVVHHDYDSETTTLTIGPVHIS